MEAEADATLQQSMSNWVAGNVLMGVSCVTAEK
jgi:hypothetical protein